MKPSSAIALVSSMPGAAAPLAFFFSQPVTNVAAKTQSNADAIVFEVLIFMRAFLHRIPIVGSECQTSRPYRRSELAVLVEGAGTCRSPIHRTIDFVFLRSSTRPDGFSFGHDGPGFAGIESF